MKGPAVLFLGLALTACGGNLAEPNGDGAGYRELPADQIMIGVRYAPTEDGMRKAMGVFDTVYMFSDSATYHLKGVQLEIFGTDGQRAANVTSTSGRLNTATDAMTAVGNVVLITPDGRKIETEELFYDPTTHRVWSDVATKMTTPDGKVGYGDSFKADDSFNRVEVIGMRGDAAGLKIRF